MTNDQRQTTTTELESPSERLDARLRELPETELAALGRIGPGYEDSFDNAFDNSFDNS